MATIKMTVSIDEETAALLRQTADRTHKPKSQVVREAIRDYSARIDRLSEEERTRLLKLVDEMMARRPERPQEEVEKELQVLRESRRGGGRRSTTEPIS